jgi:hypothetical protein
MLDTGLYPIHSLEKKRITPRPKRHPLKLDGTPLLDRARLAGNLLVALAIALFRAVSVDSEQDRAARKKDRQKCVIHLAQSKVTTGGSEVHYSDEGGDGWVGGWVDAWVDALPVQYVPL